MVRIWNGVPNIVVLSSENFEMVCLVNRFFIQFYLKNENLTQIMEFPLTSPDKIDKMEYISQRILLLIVTYVANKNFFREERLLSHITSSLLTLLVRSVR